MLMMFEQGIRGGITHISKRYSEANNKYVKDFDPKKPSKFATYLDANNLYGWTMSQRLPTHGSKWMKGSELTNDKVIKLWKSHNDYPLVPEKMKIDTTE